MLKRLLLLAFLCAAFVLLLGLMVISHADNPVPRPAVAAQSALMPSPAPAAGREMQPSEGLAAALQAEGPACGSCLVAVGVADLCQPFHLQQYFAFHYSSEAG